jgi:hypothetical protein
MALLFCSSVASAARWRARLAQLSSEIEVRIWPEIRKDELYYLILRLVQRGCGTKDPDNFDSWAISAYETAILALDAAGFVEIDKGCGRI